MKPSPEKEDIKKPKSLGIRSLKEREEVLSRLKFLKEEDRKKSEASARAEALKKLHPGQMFEGEGIFIGKYEPKDREGNSLGKIFNVFAAPQDLTDAAGQKLILNFNDAVKRVSELKNWHGHDGGDFANDTAVYNAIKEGSYKGEWCIPTRDLLVGTDLYNNKTQPDNLYAHKGKGALKGTLDTTETPGDGWYWSCTESYDNPSSVWLVRFTIGFGQWHAKDGALLSCRPVRLLPVPSF